MKYILSVAVLVALSYSLSKVVAFLLVFLLGSFADASTLVVVGILGKYLAVFVISVMIYRAFWLKKIKLKRSTVAVLVVGWGFKILYELLFSGVGLFGVGGESWWVIKYIFISLVEFLVGCSACYFWERTFRFVDFFLAWLVRGFSRG